MEKRRVPVCRSRYESEGSPPELTLGCAGTIGAISSVSEVGVVAKAILWSGQPRTERAPSPATLAYPFVIVLAENIELEIVVAVHRARESAGDILGDAEILVDRRFERHQ